MRTHPVARASRRALCTVVAGLALLTPPVAASEPLLPDPPSMAEVAAVRSTDHVLVISIDGLRPDAIDHFGATTLQRLTREGAHSYRAQTILPSKTLPSHTSMLTGVTPAVHGITWNGDRTLLTGPLKIPTVFQVARQAGQKTAAFFSKAKFHHLEAPGSLDHVESPLGWWGTWDAGHTVAQVVDDLEKEEWNLVFVHLGDPDYAGHESGWMSEPYGAAVRKADAAVYRILQEADRVWGRENYTVLLTADHGGDEHGHGLDTPAHRTIPWIAWGKGVVAGQTVVSAIETTDTAATALWLLGVPVPQGWHGVPVTSAFSAGRAPSLAATD